MFKPKKEDTLPAVQSRAVDTIIGEQCTIQGDLASPQSIKIDGKVKGNITAQGCVIIGEKAHIDGDVECNEMVLYGHLDGNIRTKNTQLKNTARIFGNIATESLQVEPGAIYQGSVVMQASDGAHAELSSLTVSQTFSLPGEGKKTTGTHAKKKSEPENTDTDDKK